MKNLHKKAFSLIEISVVIVIIGILIAGVSQGIDLYQDMRLATARTLTQNSRVVRIPDLVSWYETTSLKSIDSSQAVDGREISTWFDINPNTILPKNATQNITARKPKYNYRNPLPLINFNGITNGQFFNLPDRTIPFGDSNFTIFLVLQLASDAKNGNNDVFSAGMWVAPIALFRLYKDSSKYMFQNFSGGGSGTVYIAKTSNLPTNKLAIFTATYTNSPSRLLTAYANSIQYDSLGVANARVTSENYNMIGGNSWVDFEFFRGDIGEIIIYDRALSIRERVEIEQYLSKKWAIKIN
jgi:prepilin-type N-terminal cleavage/methylation domain-containing protein